MLVAIEQVFEAAVEPGIKAALLLFMPMTKTMQKSRAEEWNHGHGDEVGRKQ